MLLLMNANVSIFIVNCTNQHCSFVVAIQPKQTQILIPHEVYGGSSCILTSSGCERPDAVGT